MYSIKLVFKEASLHNPAFTPSQIKMFSFITPSFINVQLFMWLKYMFFFLLGINEGTSIAEETIVKRLSDHIIY